MGDVASRVVRFLVHEGWKDKLARINIVEIAVERNGCTQMVETYKSVCHKRISTHANEELVQKHKKTSHRVTETRENTLREKLRNRCVIEGESARALQYERVFN